MFLQASHIPSIFANVSHTPTQLKESSRITLPICISKENNNTLRTQPPIPLSLGSCFIRGMVAEEIEVTRVVVTPMRLSSPEGGKRKRMGSLVRSRSPNLGVRRVILMMWPMPLGSGPIASLIIVNTMRIPTSCP